MFISALMMFYICGLYTFYILSIIEGRNKQGAGKPLFWNEQPQKAAIYTVSAQG
jgi:hypothetical protein